MGFWSLAAGLPYKLSLHNLVEDIDPDVLELFIDLYDMEDEGTLSCNHFLFHLRTFLYTYKYNDLPCFNLPH
ncbi:hypothetical protein SM124_10075 [Bacillus sp. 31A1R]|uniref:EF-hand domain-containing protein n=1 Tax=Robertmurraya mangrovi TaxID=3098077 RepID=A0ABU5IY43_9BACI|nr:hypothetical protein [Bacillus sp. 31A1R]MDZ5472094.1 hypothetical protein [Bacillus sp. 31A1R]